MPASTKKAAAKKPEGLYANIQKKRERIAHGSGETMRKPGSEGAPTKQAFDASAKTAKPAKKAKPAKTAKSATTATTAKAAKKPAAKKKATAKAKASS